MTIKVAINGFGRIGRNVLRAIIESKRKDIEVVAINDLGPVETNAHLFRFDSVHGRFPGQVIVSGDTIDVGRGPIKVTAVRDPKELPHKALGVDIALECTGIFTTKEKAAAHLAAGAKRVLVSAPCDGADLTVVYGVNHTALSAEHLVVSNASCTTNCLAPVVRVLQDTVGIDKGFMTTIHAYTGDQPTLDTMHKDLYRGRAAAMSMIPTSTGAAKAIGLVIPRAQGPSRRHLDPRADAQRLGRRLQVHFQAQDHRREDQRGHRQGEPPRPAQGHPRRDRPAERLDRLQPRPALLDLRPRPDQGHGRQVRARALLVRQ